MTQAHPLPPLFAHRAFSVGDAPPAGVTRSRLRANDLEKPFHGVRAERGSSVALIRHCEAYERRMRAAEHFSHVTAARLWGIPLPRRLERAGELEVSIPAPFRAAKAAGVRGHVVKSRQLGVCIRYGMPVSDAVTTWLQLSGRVGRVDLVAAGDYLVLDPVFAEGHDDRPFTTLDELRTRTRHYRGRGKRNALAALDCIRLGVESRKETQLRLILVDAGLPQPEIGLNTYDGVGQFIARVDLAYSAQKIVVEYDGQQHRLDNEQYDRDSTRVQQLFREGWDVIRVRKETLRDAPAVVALVRTALVRRGWRG